MVRVSPSERTKDPTRKRKIGEHSRSDRRARCPAPQLKAPAMEELFSEIRAIRDEQREINYELRALGEELRTTFEWQKRVLLGICMRLGLGDPDDDAAEASASDQSPVSSEG